MNKKNQKRTFKEVFPYSFAKQVAAFSAVHYRMISNSQSRNTRRIRNRSRSKTSAFKPRAKSHYYHKEAIGNSESSTKSRPRPSALRHKEKSPRFDKEAISKVFDVSYPLPKINFRQKQAQEISQFIDSCLAETSKIRCLLLTGTPGAGKTSLAKTLLSNKKGIKTIFMNANTSSIQFQSQLSQQLIGSKLKLPYLIQHLLENKRQSKIFVLVDEFDMLFSKATADFLEIFKIFSKPIQGISLIGTSNSMEIIKKLGDKFGVSVPDFKNIVFPPYDKKQISSILLERVQKVQTTLNFSIQFEQQTLKYIVAKLHNHKGGDIRFILQQARNILDKSLKHFDSSQNKCQISFQNSSCVLAKLNKGSKITEIIKGLPFHQQLILVAINKLFDQDQCLEICMEQLEKQIKEVEKVLKIDHEVINVHELVGYLAVYDFIAIKTRHKGMKKEILLSWRSNLRYLKDAFEDDVMLGRFFWK